MEEPRNNNKRQVVHCGLQRVFNDKLWAFRDTLNLYRVVENAIGIAVFTFTFSLLAYPALRKNVTKNSSLSSLWTNLIQVLSCHVLIASCSASRALGSFSEEQKHIKMHIFTNFLHAFWDVLSSIDSRIRQDY